ncbi:unnamed protein product [Vitrella brassicaformis CCMP3155]|uniref:Methyltransferase type 11 domain-containing protein n=1 Tax=Vitrella brassicaformis (strain CCMP3155) TaxID=1169540 RepID=A0A0G4G990_VITBC|nr:unnamed protein product [Vitrella brassicaformis CCMP3155]|eukprot:CEM25235.1 unnamed protein product [Vitrella brassicaformis CCMP3155]
MCSARACVWDLSAIAAVLTAGVAYLRGTVEIEPGVFGHRSQQLFSWLQVRAKHNFTHPDAVENWIGELHGRVLEIGPGSGISLPFYKWDSIEEYVGIEPNRFFWDTFQARARERGVPAARVHLSSNVSLSGYADESFDAVVSLHVLCSVSHLKHQVSELERVLRPNGTFVFFEHIEYWEEDTWIHYLQHALNPLWRRIGEGCRLNRRTDKSSKRRNV